MSGGVSFLAAASIANLTAYSRVEAGAVARPTKHVDVGREHLGGLGVLVQLVGVQLLHQAAVRLLDLDHAGSDFLLEPQRVCLQVSKFAQARTRRSTQGGA